MTVTLEVNENLSTRYHYGTRRRTKEMDQRLEKLEQLQEQMQTQMQEKLAKLQQDMEASQRELLNQLKLLTAGGHDKGKSPAVNSGDDHEDPAYPPGFAPTNVQTHPGVYPQRVPVTIRSQYQVGAPTSLNFPTGSGSNPGDNPINIVVPDLDDAAEIEKTRIDLPKQLEDRCKWLEEKFQAMENADYHRGIDAKDLSLVPDLVLPPKFKMPEFEKYNGTSCPEAHITMFRRRMTEYINNDPLSIHGFQDSLIGSTARWYNQLSRANIHSWKDLTQAFMKQYRHVMDIAPDRIVLQNMEKKPNESFRQYAQRWREVAAQVQPPLLEKEITMLFINTLKAPFLNHMLGSATKSFSDIVMSGEMIENAIRCGKIEAGESTKRSVPRKKEHEINNTSTFNRDHSKSITVGQARAVIANQQNFSKQEFNLRPSVERPQFTPIPVTYRELYQNLFDAHVVSPFYLKPMQPPYPKWYDANAQCEYHTGTKGNSIETCTAFKKLVEKLINLGIVKIGDSSGPNVAENLLPNHDNKGVNTIIESGRKRVKANVAEIRTPLEWVWEQMVKRGLIKKNSIEKPEGARKFCEFHAEEGHDIQKCTEFRTMVQNLMDSKELEFYEEINGLEKGEVYATEEVSTGKAQKANYPVVPWNYDCNVTIPGEESLVNASGEDEGFYTRSGKRYDPANARVESGKGKALAVKLGKAKVDKIEPRVNQPVLNETYVADDISVNKLDHLVNNIGADNFIFFNDDEIPPGGRGATKALHISTH
ncbi:uncharacterized protein [Gossypium hirsutum]|uniref:Retrotransposon gag domain-containing protein n=1 Tax=Gossypium hirsutum TaxID=3635 RepID=A0ABM2ZT20_GOSHI|nr:uncharacterized protein LOC107950014 [Gossypium hirsutum]